MKEARLSHTENPVAMGGRPGLGASQRIAIQAAAATCRHFSFQSIMDISVRERLLGRFEEMCRRHDIEVPADLRRPILERLMVELWINQRALDCSDRVARKIVAGTAFSGAIGPELIASFPDFADTPHILRHAMFHRPSAPHRFLAELRENVRMLALDEVCSSFRNNPGFLTIAAKHGSNAQSFLRQAQHTFDAISSEDEFAGLRHIPYIIKEAVVGHPRNPRAFLRVVQQNMERFASQDEFTDLRKSPSVFRIAAAEHFGNPDGYLRKLLRKHAPSAVSADEHEELPEEPNRSGPTR
jgi:hypothetical protein